MLQELTYVKTLGKGTYGKVFLMKDDKGVPFALKRVSKVYEKNHQQIECLMKLNNPHVLKMYELTEDQKYYYTRCEYCNGGNLYDYQLQRPNRIFTLDEAIQILSHVVRGLEEVHRSGYIHRDLKLTNILIRDNENKKEFVLGDFGFAKKQEDIKGSILGTPQFMSPEIFLQEEYGLGIDMWAFGVIFFFMLNAQYPFKIRRNSYYKEQGEILGSETENFSYRRKVSKTKRALTENCTDEVEDLFRRMFSFDSSERIKLSEIKSHPLFQKYFSKPSQLNHMYLGSFISYEPPTHMTFSTLQNVEPMAEEELIDDDEIEKIEYGCEKVEFLQFIEHELGKNLDVLGKENVYCLNYITIKYELILIDGLLEQIKSKKYLLKRCRSRKEKMNDRIQKMALLCQENIKKIQSLNPLFPKFFQQAETQTSFTTNFKYCLRTSTSKIYQQQKKTGSIYLILLIFLCHCFNHIYNESDDLLQIIFENFLKVHMKKSPYLNFKLLQKWLKKQASENELRDIINRLFDSFFR